MSPSSPCGSSTPTALRLAVADGEMWRLWYTGMPTPDGVEAYIDTALAGQAAGTDLPFVVRDGEGEIVGSTRYCHIESDNRRLEIGYTWYARGCSARR